MSIYFYLFQLWILCETHLFSLFKVENWLCNGNTHTHAYSIDSINSICVCTTHIRFRFLVVSSIFSFFFLFYESTRTRMRAKEYQFIDEKWNLSNTNFTHTTEWTACVFTCVHRQASNDRMKSVKRNGMLVFEQFFFRFSLWVYIFWDSVYRFRCRYPDENDPVRKNVFVRRVESLIIIKSSLDADVHISSIYLLKVFFSPLISFAGKSFHRVARVYGISVCVCACAKKRKIICSVLDKQARRCFNECGQWKC